MEKKRKNRDPPNGEAAATIKTSIRQLMLDIKFRVSKVVWYVASKFKWELQCPALCKVKNSNYFPDEFPYQPIHGFSSVRNRFKLFHQSKC